MTRTLVAVSALLPLGLAFGGEPVISVALSQNSVFATGSVIDVGTDAVATFDIVVSSSVADIRPDSVSLLLNGNEILGFARLSRMADGFRASVNYAAADHPHLALAGSENVLEFRAIDEEGHTYRGSWTINAHLGAMSAVLAGRRAETPPVIEFKAVVRPQIRFSSSPRVQEFTRWKRKARAQLHFEVVDARGIRSVLIFVNGRELEAIQMRNRFPVRRRGKFRRFARLPGTVTGGSHALQIRVPVPLLKSATLVRISATNVDGFEATESVSISRLGQMTPLLETSEQEIGPGWDVFPNTGKGGVPSWRGATRDNLDEGSKQDSVSRSREADRQSRAWDRLQHCPGIGLSSCGLAHDAVAFASGGGTA